MRPLKRRRPSWEAPKAPEAVQENRENVRRKRERDKGKSRSCAATQKLMNGVNTADAQHSLCMLGIGEHRNTTIKTWSGLEWAEEARQ